MARGKIAVLLFNFFYWTIHTLLTLGLITEGLPHTQIRVYYLGRGEVDVLIIHYGYFDHVEFIRVCI